MSKLCLFLCQRKLGHCPLVHFICPFFHCDQMLITTALMFSVFQVNVWKINYYGSLIAVIQGWWRAQKEDNVWRYMPTSGGDVSYGVSSTIFNNTSFITWRFSLLVEEIGVPGENYWHVTSHWQNHIKFIGLSRNLPHSRWTR